MPFRRHVLVLFLAAVLPPAAFAQRVYWDPPGGRLGFGKIEDVRLVFEDCTPTDALQLPQVAGLDFGRPMEARQTSIINDQMTTRILLTYPVRATARGDAVIPAFDAATNKGRLAVGEVRFVVSDASVGPTGLAIGEIVSSQLRASRTTVWAGEVVDFEYLLTASPRYNVSIGSEPDWKPDNVVLEPFSSPERAEATVGAERRQAVRYRARGLFNAAGTLTLPPVNQVINVQTGERAAFPFSQPRMEQFNLDSAPVPVTVRALPAPAPAGFRGAVGTFQLESTVVPETARIGEPITWTLKLSGTGNWTAGLALPERQVSADFEVVQPKSRTEMAEGRLFEGSLTEDAVLVPTVAGSYTFGPVEFTYFDPAAGQYRTQTIAPVTVKIDPVRAGAASAVPLTAPEVAAPPSAPSGLPGAAVAAPVPPLPGDLAAPASLPGMPLPVGVSAAAPRALPPPAWLLLPLLAPLALWFALASREALRTDPERHRRRALRDLRRFLRDLQRRGVGPDAATLEQWRTLTARLWAVRRATPTADDLAAALAATRGAPRPDDWLALWREAEHAMFSAAGGLPEDWVARALAAATSARIRFGAPWWPGQARHWAPRLAAALALVLLAGGPARLDAAEAREAYREGRFAEARDAWLEFLARHPLDWAAHANVALANAQLDAWGVANAHSTAAFLLNPRDAAVRRQLRLAVTHLDGVDPHVRRVIDGPWYDRPVSWLSPAEWHSLLLGGVGVVTLALAALVASLHVQRRRAAVRATGQAMAAVGLAAIVIAALALWRYGPLADPQAAMVVQPVQLNSIPSDAAEKQKSTPIAPGSVVVIERPFLGWCRVRGRGDTAGWIRREQLLPFYAAAAATP